MGEPPNEPTAASPLWRLESSLIVKAHRGCALQLWGCSLLASGYNTVPRIHKTSPLVLSPVKLQVSTCANK